MCKKKKAVEEPEVIIPVPEEETVDTAEEKSEEERLEKERLEAIMHPEKHDYFAEYYQAYKNQYIDQYLRAYAEFKETGKVSDIFAPYQFSDVVLPIKKDNAGETDEQ